MKRTYSQAGALALALLLITSAGWGLLGAAPSPAASDAMRLSASPQHVVPILMYHLIAPGPNNLYVPPSEFEQHLAYLAENGYHSVTLQQLYAHFVQGKPLPGHAVVIIFDDGYESVYTAALPLLEKYRMVGTFFVASDTVGTPGHVSWLQLKGMVGRGMEIGSHSVSHPDLRSLDEDALQQELGESRRRLEAELGVPVPFMSYPRGLFDEKTLAAMPDYYQGALGTASAMATSCQDRYQWQRIQVDQKVEPEKLGELLDSLAEQAAALCP